MLCHPCPLSSIFLKNMNPLQNLNHRVQWDTGGKINGTLARASSIQKLNYLIYNARIIRISMARLWIDLWTITLYAKVSQLCLSESLGNKHICMACGYITVAMDGSHVASLFRCSQRVSDLMSIQQKKKSTIAATMTTEEVPTKSVTEPLIIPSNSRDEANDGFTRVHRHFCASAPGTILLINIIITIAVRKGVHRRLAIIQEGRCSKTASLDLWLHLLINVLGTILLGASNYCMQCVFRH